MARNVKERNTLREQYVNLVNSMFAEYGEDVLQVASNRIAFPVVGDEGGEYFVTVTVAIPTGERGGDAYDGYAFATEYKMKCEKKSQIAKEKANKKKGK